jgi:hypothetical protein
LLPWVKRPKKISRNAFFSKKETKTVFFLKQSCAHVECGVIHILCFNIFKYAKHLKAFANGDPLPQFFFIIDSLPAFIQDRCSVYLPKQEQN